MGFDFNGYYAFSWNGIKPNKTEQNQTQLN